MSTAPMRTAGKKLTRNSTMRRGWTQRWKSSSNGTSWSISTIAISAWRSPKILTSSALKAQRSFVFMRVKPQSRCYAMLFQTTLASLPEGFTRRARSCSSCFVAKGILHRTEISRYFRAMARRPDGCSIRSPSPSRREAVNSPGVA